MTNPHKRYCEKCGMQFGGAWQAMALAQHKWEAHGIPGEATFNGTTKRFGPEPTPPKTFRQRLKTGQFFDNRPANWAFNLLVMFPLSMFASGLLAMVVLTPVAHVLDAITPEDPVEKCKGEMDRTTRIECFERLSR